MTIFALENISEVFPKYFRNNDGLQIYKQNVIIWVILYYIL